MESLFETSTADKFIERINKLRPETPALWGKMSVDQMLVHCQKPLEIASGDLVPKVNPLIRFLFGKSAKKGMTGNAPVKKNLPTFNEAKIAGRQAFDLEKTKLIALLENFQKKGTAGLTKEKHPLFGHMSAAEWNALEVKHLDHHLQQFGV